MEKRMSCCGMICSECGYYPADCRGCGEIKGKVFWLEYTGEDCCEIYKCCVKQNGYQNCGQCEKLPCSHYENSDPTKTKEENEADHCKQMKNLERYPKAVYLESMIGLLEDKDTSEAYKALQELEKISDETGLTYCYIDKFVDMLSSDKYVIRVRGFRLFCRQAKWDTDFIMDENIDTALNILEDEKPTAVRQALAAVADIVRYKPDLREAVRKAVSDINYLRYKETMHSLLAKDIDTVLSLIRELKNLTDLEEYFKQASKQKKECSMNIRRAEKSEVEILLEYDKHIRKEEMESLISLGRVSIVEDSGTFTGWLRWNLFWDNTPFLNMLFLLDQYRKIGNGKEILSHWEKQMKEKGYAFVMTSSLANEEAQHFYRKSGYIDSGALLLPGEPLEIIFTKKI